jgi:hypothetical protein
MRGGGIYFASLNAKDQFCSCGLKRSWLKSSETSETQQEQSDTHNNKPLKGRQLPFWWFFGVLARLPP